MTAVPRHLIALGAVGILLGAIAIAVAFRLPDAARWGPDLLVGWALIGAGLTGLHRLPDNAVSWLVVATGMLWFAGNFASLGHPVVEWIAAQALFLHRGPLIHAVLAFPSGHLRSSRDRAAVATAYAAALAPLAQVHALVILVGLVVIGASWAGWRRAVGPERRARRAVLPAGIAMGGVLAGGAMLRSIDGLAIQDAWLLAIYLLVVVGVALWLIWQLVEGGWRSAAIADLIVPAADIRRGGLRARLARALGDPSLQIAYAAGHHGYVVDELGRPVTIPHGDTDRAVTRVEWGSHGAIVLMHDSALLLDPGLAASVATAVGLAGTNARLEAEVRQQIAIVRASRRDLVRTIALERRSLQGQLRAGAMRRLASLERLIQDALAGSSSPPPEAIASLRIAAERSASVQRDLTRLGTVLHPLAGRNLEAAVRELAAESPIPTEVSVDELDMPEEIATELYFVCAEGLANAAKHSAATACSISAMATDGGVLLRITDDGHGGATLIGSSGLRGLVDRVEALGGMVTIVSSRGRGTRIEVDLPLSRQ